MKPAFSKKYSFLFVLILLTEVYIALFVNDRIIRPFVGDVLIVVLMYAFVRMLFNVHAPFWLAIGILFFSFMVEVGQYFNLVSRLGLTDSKFATVVIGTSFDWRDLVAYTLGFGLILAESRGSRRGKYATEDHNP